MCAHPTGAETQALSRISGRVTSKAQPGLQTAPLCLTPGCDPEQRTRPSGAKGHCGRTCPPQGGPGSGWGPCAGEASPTHAPPSTCVSRLCCVASAYGPAEAAPAATQPRRELFSSPRAGSRGTSAAGPVALGPCLTTLVCLPWAAQAPGLDAGVQLLSPALPLTPVWLGPGLPPGPRAPSGKQGAVPPRSGRPGPDPRPCRPHGSFPLCQPRPTAGPQSPRNSHPQIRSAGCFLFPIRKSK